MVGRAELAGRLSARNGTRPTQTHERATAGRRLSQPAHRDHFFRWSHSVARSAHPANRMRALGSLQRQPAVARRAPASARARLKETEVVACDTRVGCHRRAGAEGAARASDDLVDRALVLHGHEFLQAGRGRGGSEKVQSAVEQHPREGREREARDERGTHEELVHLDLGLVVHLSPLVLERVLGDERWRVGRAERGQGLACVGRREEGGMGQRCGISAGRGAERACSVPRPSGSGG